MSAFATINFLAQNLQNGSPLPGATVTVYKTGTTTKVNVYDMTGASLGNPMVADSTGLVQFQIDAGIIADVVWSAGSYTSPRYAVGVESASVTAILAQSLSAPSTSPLTVAVGTKTLVVRAGLAFFIGERVVIANSSTIWMAGVVSSYNDTLLTVEVDSISGAGLFSVWTVGLAGQRGPTGPVNTLSIGTVTTLSPGAAATATIGGTAPTQTLSLGLPAGTPWSYLPAAGGSVKVANAATLPSFVYATGVMTASANGAFPSIDGVALSVGDRFWHWDYTGANGSNLAYGIYTLTNAGSAGTKWTATRAVDADTAGELGLVYAFVTQGTVNGGMTLAVTQASGAITLGTTAIVVATVAGNASVVAEAAARVAAISDLQTQITTNLTAPITPLVAISSSKNLFDYTKVTEGFEIYPTGTPVSAYPTASVSSQILVENADFLTVSGLSGAGTVTRYFVFFDTDGVTILSRAFIPAAATIGSVAVPAARCFVQFTTRSREAMIPTYSNIQLETGSTASALVAYANPQITRAFGYDIARTPPVNLTGQKNLFDKNNVRRGVEVYGDGALLAEPNSVVSNLIDVSGEYAVTISGLQAAGTYPNNYVCFYAEDGSTVVKAGVYITPAGVHVVYVPDGGKTMLICVKQRNSNAEDLSQVQIEYGTRATVYEAFKPRLAKVNTIGIQQSYARRPLDGLRIGVIGTSKDQVATVTDTSTPGAYTDGTRENWQTFAKPRLGGTWRNYAYSGASYLDFFPIGVGQTHTNAFQNISYQLQRMQIDGFLPDLLIMGGPTNDHSYLATHSSQLGSVSAALAVTGASQTAILAALDRTNYAQALRWCIMYAKINFPGVDIHVATCQQRGGYLYEDLEAVNGIVRGMAAHYAVTVHDQAKTCGIVGEFESGSGSGGYYLQDGTHETTTSTLVAGFAPGTMKMGDWWTRELGSSYGSGR